MAKGFFVLFGPPGAGKSYSAARTFQNSCYFASAPNNLHYYKTWLETPEAKDLKLTLPKREFVIDQYSVDGKVTVTAAGPVAVPQKVTLEHYIRMVVSQSFQAKAEGKPPPFNYVIFDELSTFWNRVFADIQPTVLTKDGKPNLLGAFGQMGDWSSATTNYLRQLIAVDVGLVFITHDQEPDTTADKKGGPKLTSQAVMRQVCSDADGVLLRMIEDPPLDLNNPNAPRVAQRYWKAHASQHWLSKLRGLPDSMFDQIRTMDLGDILKSAGFTV